MSVATLLRQTITIRRRTPAAADAHGNPTWNVTTTTVTGHLQPQASSLELADGHGTVDGRRGRLYLPAGTVIGPDDEIVVDGTTWRVIGPARTITRPHRPGAHHLETDVATHAP